MKQMLKLSLNNFVSKYDNIKIYLNARDNNGDIPVYSPSA